ncbi:aminoglycoside phosphotransferase family enzyme/predicted kinase [Actimicrobium sp. GrIS 1.19]|uniref:bifunctional aminoglycoside phosphotransferase/ATP-binding protein n=1 Tax=Actimicrobium sp. GrIS 1.19 TaxID=3071708 RepID=UPI002E0CDBD3|nr:aminoglycoside phosphotransferase family enzyme/predicted kinase [Actimicrobium sp. GrIS 1.19]
MTALRQQETLVRAFAALLERQGPQGTQSHLFQTHLSWVIVAGHDAYKFKKAVRFDFVDFSTVAARHYYCAEELRLNRRLAPWLYLEVVALTGTVAHPVVGGSGPVLDHAVRMQAFAQQCLWSERADSGALTALEIDALADQLASFHQAVPVAASDCRWGKAAAVCQVADENLAALAGLAGITPGDQSINRIVAWQAGQHRRMAPLFEQRLAQGFVRECHGDLHAANVITVDASVTAFDCLEFSEPLRWIDVISDLAFIVMDLACHGAAALAARLLDRYLLLTGDYGGLQVLRYYQIQRALVRARIALLRRRQHSETLHNGAIAAAASAPCPEATRYLDYVAHRLAPEHSAIILMHGYSGSGKSVYAQHLLELIGAIRLRSDVERKRMHGIDPAARRSAPIGQGLYTEASSDATHQRLLQLTQQIVATGTAVIIDAAFLQKARRGLFCALAEALRVPFFIIDLHASEATLRGRIVARQTTERDASDAGVEVLQHQYAQYDPIGADEARYLIVVDAEAPFDDASVKRHCAPLLAALQSDRDRA